MSDICLGGFWHGSKRRCRVCGSETGRFGQIDQMEPISLCEPHLCERAVEHFTHTPDIPYVHEVWNLRPYVWGGP